LLGISPVNFRRFPQLIFREEQAKKELLRFAFYSL